MSDDDLAELEDLLARLDKPLESSEMVKYQYERRSAAAAIRALMAENAALERAIEKAAALEDARESKHRERASWFAAFSYPDAAARERFKASDAAHRATAIRNLKEQRHD